MAGQRSSRGIGSVRKSQARIKPTARPSRTRSTTRVATEVQKRGPWREAM